MIKMAMRKMVMMTAFLVSAGVVWRTFFSCFQPAEQQPEQRPRSPESVSTWADPSVSLTVTFGDTTSGALWLFESFCPITEGNLCWLSFQSASLVAVDAGNPTFRHSFKLPIIQRFIPTIFSVNKYLNSGITWSRMRLLLLFAHFIAGTSG